MKDLVVRLVGSLCALALAAGAAVAKPSAIPQNFAPVDIGETGLVGDLDGSHPMPAKALNDTIWIADWTFDAPGGGCDDTGWVKMDNRILNDGSNYWWIGTDFNGTNGIVNRAAILSTNDLCGSWSGYGSNWDYSIICKYRGPGATLSFNFVSDSEPGFDFLKVQADSAGGSEALVNYAVDPTTKSAAVFREELLVFSGLQATSSVSALVLPDFGQPSVTHEVYLNFVSDGAYDDEDGVYPSHWGAGCVVDNIVVTGGLSYAENFEGSLNANVTLVNSSLALPFGEWARVYLHITDNDLCTENTTCAWLWTDPLKIATFSDMAFGPGSAVIHKWLDDIIVGPWVSLASTPGATNTILSMRRFPGNAFTKGHIVQNWSVQSKFMVGANQCIGAWDHASSWNSLTSFVWATNIWDMTTYINPAATDIRLRLRVSDWSYIMAPVPPPATFDPGPGPYNDRIRIGRRVLTGPSMNPGIDERFEAQDCFPTKLASFGVPGRTVAPQTDTSAPLYPYLFGSCAFTMSTDLTIGSTGPNVVPGDSILMTVTDARGAGGVTSVKLYGAIVAGPHQGKGMMNGIVGANGFFEVTADSAKTSSGYWIANRWRVFLRDDYFRGGDKLVYYWQATDAAGGKASYPPGISGTPSSVAQAEQLTGGLLEVSYLPTIDWDAGYLARVAADPEGDVAPAAAEVAGSSQRNCILYNQHTNSARHSGETNRTAFMYALDRLGYRGCYDVYDHTGYGNTNNQLGSRATNAQCGGYALIIEDDFRSSLIPNIPDGSSLDDQKVRQVQWYQTYLAQGLTSRAGTATFWLIGENTAADQATSPLMTNELGLTTISNDQALAVSPEVAGVGSATTWDNCTMSFAGDLFTLAGGCPNIRAYDAAAAAGSAVVTHRYKVGTVTGSGAIVMNKNAVLHWNTVWMGFGWNDIRNPGGAPALPDKSIQLLQKILACVLPENCRKTPNVTENGGGDPTNALPRVSALHQNVPNPFNPTTTIRFDLAREGHVELRIYDVAGRRVKTLMDGSLAAGWNIGIPWSGLDEAGARVPSGVYFYQLVTDDLTATKKMVLMK